MSRKIYKNGEIIDITGAIPDVDFSLTSHNSVENKVVAKRFNDIEAELENVAFGEKIETDPEVSVEPRDADTLGGRYTAEDIDTIQAASGGAKVFETYNDAVAALERGELVNGVNVKTLDDDPSNILASAVKYVTPNNTESTVKEQLDEVNNKLMHYKTFSGSPDSNGNVLITNSSTEIVVAIEITNDISGYSVPIKPYNGATYAHATTWKGVPITSGTVSGIYYYFSK